MSAAPVASAVPDLKKIATQSRNLFLIGGIICLAIIYLMSWCVYQMYKLVKNWYDGNKKIDTVKVTSNPISDASNDNESYMPPASDQEDDQYDTITKSIKDSFQSFKSYNEKLANYYTHVKNSPPPDTIDKGVLLPSNDNW